MRLLSQKILSLLVIIFISQISYAQFIVNNGASAIEMAQELVGPGVQIISASYIGDYRSSGIFTAASTSLPMENGVALSTGWVTEIAGEAWRHRSRSMGTNGDASLNSLVGCSSCTRDAAILEFQFKAIGDEINFEFVFGSEEYPTYVCSQYNDVFGFFLSGPGITGEKNLALVPGTTVPVSINTINNHSNPGYECTKYGQGSPFPQYYIDNSGSSTIAYNGLTTTLTAHQEIQECEIYTIRLAIADVNDRVFDSGVFIKSNSFQTQTPELTLNYDPEFPICPRDEVTLTAILDGVDPPIDYFWFLNYDMVGQDSFITFFDLQEGDRIRLVVSADVDCDGTKLESEEIIVTFLPPNEEELNITICEGESYTFDGITYTESIYGVYMTEPDPPNCDKKTTLNLTVEPPDPTYFDDLGPFCQDDTPPDLPPTDLNGTPGTWDPAVISTDVPGIFTYTFTPDGGICAAEYIMFIEIEAPEIPIFDPVDPLCQDSNPIDLPTISNNIPPISGSWSPSPVNTDVPGITTYTFTPDPGQCADPTTLDIEVTAPEIPIFDQIGPLCETDAAPTLPTSSNNIPPIYGTWSPAIIDMGTIGTQTYTFIPNSDECAEEVTMDIEILEELKPTFDQLGPYCKGDTPDDLPTSSDDDPAITGTWSPSVISTDNPGTFTYTFTPDADICAEEYVMTIEIEQPVDPEFPDLGPFCQDETAPDLPTTSDNGFTGSWDPSTIATDVPGTFTYTFTPDAGQCAEEYTMTIEIEAPEMPVFDPVDPLCQDSAPIDLPTTSNNGITGSWSPSPVNTDAPGITTYTFTPDAGQCADPTTLDIEVTAPEVPIFDPIGPLCETDVAPTLPSSSNNVPPISGSWSPAIIDMGTIGTQTYTFTPNADECAEEVTMDIEILEEITPEFDDLGPYCKGDIPDDLPPSSNNDPTITGTWSPSVISTDNPGTFTYTFTPDAGICAEEYVMTIEIEQPEDPEFPDLGPFCQDETAPDLPTTSDNGFTGSWTPSVISTDVPGTYTYTFTPDAGQCAEEYTMIIEIEAPEIPVFDPVDPLCQDSAPIDLPTTSNNGITGSWSPSPVNTDAPGITTYTFTPDAGQCADPTTLDIEVTAPEIPVFDPIGPLCETDVAPILPSSSNNVPPISGSWSPAIIDMGTIGTQTYTFIPNPDECAEEVTMDIEILEELTPTFDDLGPYCLGDVADNLPNISNDSPGITGSWDPAVISTDVAGSHKYVFTPDAGICAEPYIMTVVIEQPAIPEFPDFGPYCQDDTAPNLPTTSDNGITGVWSPTVIATDVPGTFTYTFTPDAGLCAEEYTITIEIEKPVIPTFDPVDPLCQNSDPIDLLTKSNDNPPIIGSWSPSPVNTDNPGITTYTFTPDVGQCADPTTLDIEVIAPETPVFDQVGPLCQFDIAPVLPTSSNNSPPIEGKWIPVSIDMSTSGTQTFTFIPNSDECAEEVTMDIEILEELKPTFDQLGPYCQGDTPDELPTNSNDDPIIKGTWSPSVISTDASGVFIYTFTPDPDYCAATVIMQVVVESPAQPTFTQLGPYCRGETPDELPTKSNNNPSITGTWTPSVITTDSPGSYTFTFTPDSEFCASEYTMTIEVEQPIIPSFNTINPICQGSTPPELPKFSTDFPAIGGTWDPSVINTDDPGTTTYSFTPAAGQCALPTTIDIEITPIETPVFDQIGPLCQSEDAPELPNYSNNNPPISGAWIPGYIDMNITGTRTYTFFPNPDECAESVTMQIEVIEEVMPTFNQLGPYCQDEVPDELPQMSLDNPAISGTWSPSAITTDVPGTYAYVFTPDAEFCAAEFVMLVVVNEPVDPIFVPINPICQYTQAPILPSSSLDYPPVQGNWEPAIIDTDIAGTFTYTFTPNSEECAISTTMEITVLAPEIPTFDEMGPYCLNANSEVLPATSTNNPPIQGEWIPSMVITSQPGIHEYLFVPNSNFCAEELIMEIEVLDLPEITIEPIDPLCKDSAAVELVAHPEGGFWYGTNVENGFFNPVSVGQFVVFYTYVDDNDCINTVSISVRVEDCSCLNPASADAGPDDTICAGASYTLSGQITVATEAFWTTSGTGTFDDPGLLNATYTPSQQDIDAGYVMLTLTTIDHDDDGPCSEVSSEMRLNIEQIPVNIQAVSPVCEDAQPVELRGNPTYGIWSGPGVANNYFDPAQAGAGTHTITLSLPDGCIGSATIDIIVNPLPEVTIDPVDNLCLDDDAITLVGNPAGGTFSGTGVVGSRFRPEAVGSFNVEYQYTDGNGCSNSATITIVVENCGCEEPATADAGENATVCYGDTYTLNGSITNVNNATWTTSGTGTFDNPNLLNATYTPSQADYVNGSVILTLTTDDPDGTGPCEAVSDQMRIIFENVNITITPVSPLCADDNSVTLTAQPVGGSWSGPGVINNIFNPVQAGAGTHTIRYTISLQCEFTEEITITVYPLPQIEIEPVTDICLDDDPFDLTATPAGGTWSGSLVQNGQFYPTEAGMHIITYTYTDENGCSNSATSTILVGDCDCEDPATADAGEDATICVGDSYKLDGSVSNVTNATWTTSGTGTFDNPNLLKATYTPSQEDYDNGSVILTLTTDDPDGEEGPCSAVSASMTLTFAKVEISITPQDNLCEDDNPVTLIATPAGGNWSGTGVNGDSFDPTQAGIGTHLIRYTYTDENGCSGEASIEITVEDCGCENPATADAGEDASICVSETYTLNGSITNANNASWSTSGSGTFDDPNLLNATYTPSQEDYDNGSVVLTLTTDDPDGEEGPCSAVSASMTLSFVKVEISITAQDNLCEDDAAVTLIATPAGGNWSGTGVNGDSFDPTQAGIGTHLIRYTYTDENGCSAEASIEITVEDCGCENPATVDAGEDASICVSETYTLNGSMTNVDNASWSTSGSGTFDDPNLLNATYTPSQEDYDNGSVVLTLTTDDPDGEEGPCSAVSASMTLSFNQVVITITEQDDLCEDAGSVTLTASPAGGSWSGPGVNGNTFNPAQAGPGTHTIKYSIDGQCPATEEISITVFPLPQIVIEPVDEMCIEESITLIATPVGGTWSGDYLSGSTFTPMTSGSFDLKYSYTDANGCSSFATITIVVEDCGCEDPARANAGEDATICESETYTLNGSITNVNNATWTTSGTGTFDDPGRLDATYTPSQEDYDNGSVRLTLITDDPDGDGPCRPASDAMILSFIKVAITITPQTGLCEDADAVTLIATPTGGNWSGPGVNGNSFDPKIAGPGTHTIVYSVDGQCPATEEINITVYPLPQINIEPIDEMCIEESVTLIATPAGGSWSGENITGNIFTPQTGGNYTLVYTYTDANGCSNSAMITISVEDCGCEDPPTAYAGQDATICYGESYTLDGSITNANSGTWTTSGSGTFDNANRLDATYTPSQEDYNKGSVRLTLTTDDPDGDGPCKTASDYMILNIVYLGEINLLVQNADCNNPMGSLTILPPASELYNFSLDNGNSFTDSTKFILEPGSYTLIYMDPISGCRAEADFIIKPAPVIDVNWKLTSQACSGAKSNYIDIYSVRNMTLPVEVYIDGVFKATISSFPARINHLDLGEHSLFVMDSGDCLYEDNFTISEFSDIGIEIEGLYIINEGESAVLAPTVSKAYTSISWSPPDYLSCTSCHSPTVTPKENMMYWVTVTDEQGCQDSAMVRVVIRKNINVYTPNIFTPNNDGINDYFTIYTDDKKIDRIENLKVYSRWGELLYENSKFPPNVPTEGWDGTFKGQPMDPDVFMWNAEIDIPGEGLRIIRGDVSLIR